MLKYFSAFLLIFTLISCQNDSGSDEQAQQQQQPSLQDQMQQPAPDINVSDSEIEQFADAVSNVQEVQMNSQQSMVEAIRDEGLDVETFNQIAEGRQKGQSADEIGVTGDDMEKFDNVTVQLDGIQQNMEGEVQAAVEETGMEMQRFEEINRAVQQDPELQKRIREEIQSGQMQQPEPEN